MGMNGRSGSTGRARVIEQSRVNTGRSYELATAAFESSIGRLEHENAKALVLRGASWNEVEAEMARMAGPSGLMLFTQYDQGSVASLAGKPIRCRVYLVGNPALAAQIVRIDIRGSFYVPFRVAIFESDAEPGAITLFDRPSSFLATLERPQLDEIGKLLDAKIDAVVQRVRQP
jgi:uncharacterized protein (DUF302 family)